MYGRLLHEGSRISSYLFSVDRIPEGCQASDKEITVGGYIDTVLACHLEQHKDEIKELYKKQLENLI